MTKIAQKNAWMLLFSVYGVVVFYAFRHRLTRTPCGFLDSVDAHRFSLFYFEFSILYLQFISACDCCDRRVTTEAALLGARYASYVTDTILMLRVQLLLADRSVMELYVVRRRVHGTIPQTGWSLTTRGRQQAARRRPVAAPSRVDRRRCWDCDRRTSVSVLPCPATVRHRLRPWRTVRRKVWQRRRDARATTMSQWKIVRVYFIIISISRSLVTMTTPSSSTRWYYGNHILIFTRYRSLHTDGVQGANSGLD